MEQNLQLVGIPLLTTAACIYFAVKLLIFKDTDSIRGNMNKKLKDKDSYAKFSGIILLIFGVCSALMAVLLLVNIKYALIQILISLFITALLWSLVEKNFGSTD